MINDDVTIRIITIIVDVSNMSSRAGVLVSARVHPGETNSSWMMQGLIDWLTSDAAHAKVHYANPQPDTSALIDY